ncbi:MAG: thioesterase family protein [Myxococcota bacterium]|nr:thioesterase family protein [Myxococcota bacterium]
MARVKKDDTPVNTSLTKVRVLYADTDRMGVVYHGTYFRWFEAGRADYMRKRGSPYAAIERDKLFLPVIEANAVYAKPATYDEILVVKTWVSEITKTTLTFSYLVSRDEDALVHGFTRHVAVNEQGKPLRLPSFIVRALGSMERLETELVL